MTNKAIAEQLGISTAVLSEWKWSIRHCPRLSPLTPDMLTLTTYQQLVKAMGLTKSRRYLKEEF